MERYMIHLVNSGYGPADSREIVHRARFLCANLALVRVARVATSFVELDVSVEKDDFDTVVAKLRPIGGLDNARHVVEEEIPKEKGIRDGIFYFNSERFWEAHEAWEGVWKQCHGVEKSLVQGLILVAVAFAHAQKNDVTIGIGIFGRALEKLGGSSGVYYNIDVNDIRGRIAEMRRSGKMTLFTV